MLKNILNLNGAQELNKSEQKSVYGGNPFGITVGCGSSTCGVGLGICGQHEECTQVFCGPYGSADENGWEFVYQCIETTNQK